MSENGETGAQWRVRYICCETSDGESVHATWASADRAREAYVASGKPSGNNAHERQAIVTGPPQVVEIGTGEAMADRRLDDIGKGLLVADGPTIAYELYDEVQRLRALEQSYIVALDQANIGDMQRLAADRDAATERAEKAEAQVERWNRAATLLEAGCIVGQHSVFETIAALTERAETAERELAELREQLRVRWGYGPHKSDITPVGSAVYAGEVARARGEKRWTQLATNWQEVPDAG